MNILLINPPQTYPKQFYEKTSLRACIPTGLIQIASFIEREGYKPKIIDAFTLSDEILHETADCIHFGATWDTIKESIRKEKPNIVGITNQFTSQKDNAIAVAKLVKEIDTNIITVIGGPHASVRPEDFLSAGFFDFAVLREGEYSFRDILLYLEKKKKLEEIEGIVYKKGENIVKNKERDFIKDLDSLPLPAYHLLDLEKYFELFKKGYGPRKQVISHRTISVITSRGCPFNCCFCSIHLHIGRIWRANSPEYVLKHLELLKDKYNVKHIRFEDDNLTLDKNRFEQILDGMIAKDFNFVWDTPNGVRADFLDENLVRKSIKSGCKRLIIGVESGDQDVLDRIIGKNLKLENVIKAAKICKKLGLDLQAFFVVGFPGETKQNIKSTFDFAYMLNKKYDVAPSFTIANPLIGTRLYKEAKEKGYLIEELNSENLMLGSLFNAGGLIKTEDFSPEELRYELDKFYKKLFLLQLRKPSYILKRFIRSPQTFLFKAAILMNFAFSKKTKRQPCHN